MLTLSAIRLSIAALLRRLGSSLFAVAALADLPAAPAPIQFSVPVTPKTLIPTKGNPMFENLKTTAAPFLNALKADARPIEQLIEEAFALGAKTHALTGIQSDPSLDIAGKVGAAYQLARSQALNEIVNNAALTLEAKVQAAFNLGGASPDLSAIINDAASTIEAKLATAFQAGLPG